MTRRRAVSAVLAVATVVAAACTSGPAPGATAPGATAPGATAPGTAGSGAPSSGRPSTYVALGDSVAAGVGAPEPDRGGYVPVLGRLLSERLGCGAGSGAPRCPVEVRNLAVAGATTETVLRDQLPAAAGLLRDEDVRLVTVTVGGNDVFGPVVLACAQAPADPACRAAVVAALDGVDRRLDRLLAALTGEAGTRTPVAVMTYYDPLPACRLAPLQPLAEQVLEGAAGRGGLNDVLRARAAEHGAVVVEAGERLSARGDFVGGDDCLHPSGPGHARLAQAFLDAVGAGDALRPAG